MGELNPDRPEFDDPRWELVVDHPFINADVQVEIGDRVVEGVIDSIWEYRGDPERVDIRTEDDEIVNIKHGDDGLEFRD